MILPPLLKGRRRKHFAALVINGLAQAIVAIGFAKASKTLFDQQFQSAAAASPQWVELSAGLIILVLIIASLRRRERIDAELLGQLYVRDLRKRLFRRLLSSQYVILAAQRRGQVLIRFVNDMNGVRQWVSLGLARLTVAAVVVVVVMVALWRLHPAFAFSVGSSLGLMALALWWQGKRLRKAIAEVRRRQGHISANMTEKIASLATIQLLEQSGREELRLARQNRRLVNTAQDKAAAIGSLRAVTEMGVGLAFASSLITAVYLSRLGLAGPGSFVAVFSVIGFLTAPLRDASRAHEYWLARRVALANMQRLSSRLKPLGGHAGSPIDQHFEGGMVFTGVSITGAVFPLTTEVCPGQRVALVGANGAGKTTLLHAIVRLRDFDQGDIMLDGVSIRDLPRKQLHEQVAYVGNDVPLLRTSLRNNLLYGNPGPDQEAFESICRQCGIEEIVRRLPEGLETRIAEAGSNLSQGERARICLARALMLRPKVLLLDEADAHLDLMAVKAFSRVLADFPGTVLMATHRREAVRNADVIWHLHQGRLVGHGAPENLLTRVGPTRQLFFGENESDSSYRAAG